MPSLKLDKERTIKWSMRTEFRLGSPVFPTPPRLDDLNHKSRSKRFYSLCAHIWACLEDQTDFPSAEMVAEWLSTDEQQTAAIKALYEALVEAGLIVEKKTTAPKQ